MTDRGDGNGGRDRAVTVQIGAVILFGFLIVALSTYQATVVPDQNAEVEFLHNQEVQTDMVQLSDSIAATGRLGRGAPATVQLGTRYPSRAIFVNPPPASGRLRTVPPDSSSVAIENFTVDSSATGDADDYWGGSFQNTTMFVVYEPNYAQYRAAPTTRYESGILFNRFPDSGTAIDVAGSGVIDDERLTLVIVKGDLSRSGSSATSVDPSAVSVVQRRERISSDGTGPLTVTVPTTLSADQWKSFVGSDATVTNGSGDSVRLNLGGGSYALGIAVVELGTDTESAEKAYIDVERAPESATVGRPSEVVVEVRDEYGNPVAGASVNATDSSALGTFVDTKVQTGDDGRAVFEYTPDSTGDATLDFSFDTNPAVSGDFDANSPEDARVELDNVAGGGGGSAPSLYTLVWDVPTITSQPGVENGSGDVDIVVERAVSGNTVEMTVRTTDGGDPVSGVSVDYASNDSVVAGFTGVDSEGETGGDGRSTVTMDVAGNDTAKVYASSTESGDVLTVRVLGGNSVYYRYYEGDFGNNDQPSSLNLDSRTPVESGEKTQFTIGPENRDDDFAYAYTAYIEVPQDGTYTFYTNSDDGSWLYIDGSQIVDNGGDHAAQEESGTVTLTEGQHNITVYMYENQGQQALDVSWEGPGTGGKQVIPTSVLSPRLPASDDGGGGGGGGGTAASRTSYVDGTGSAARSGPESRVDLDIENTGSADVVITGIEVSSTSGSLRTLREGRGGSGAGQHEVYIDSSTPGLLEPDGSAGSGNEGGQSYQLGTEATLTESATLAGGETAQVTLLEFRNNGGQTASAADKQLTVTLYFDDGSSTSFTFTPPGY